jgi:glycine oxidase
VASPEVVVVGGGIVGCSVAFHLARAGVSTCVLERGEVGGEASGAAAGMLLPVSEADDKGPLLAWGLRSLDVFPELIAELRERSGVDPEYEPCGALHVADRPGRGEALRATARILAECDVHWLDAGGLRARAPQLAANAQGALWSPREAHVRSDLLTRAYARAAAQCGARIEPGVEVVGLSFDAERVCGVQTASGVRPAGHVILCTGAWAAHCGGWLPGDFSIPVTPVRGQILSLEAPLPAPREILAGDDVYLVPRRDGSLTVGATIERVGFDDQVTAAGVARLLRDAFALVPTLAEARFAGAWSGLRPETPDRLPLIGGAAGVEGLAIAAGHYRNGVLLSPVTGAIVTDLVLGRGLPDDAAAFAPDRFGTRYQKPPPSAR